MNASIPIIIDGCNPSKWDDPDVYKHLKEGKVVATNATVAIWENYVDSVDGMATWLKRFRDNADTIMPIRTVADIHVARATGKTGIIIGWQNMSPIEDDFERLEVFYALGLRVAQLTYNIRNLIGNGVFERRDDGISRFGVMAIQKMNELGILIDLSHTGDASSRDAIEFSEQPVAFTHANLRELNNSPRNKPAELIKLMAEKGGVIGACSYPRFLPKGFDSTMDDYIDVVEALIELVGIEHVAIASDFGEGHEYPEFFHYLRRLHGKAPGEPLDHPNPNIQIPGFERADKFPVVVDALAARGFDDAQIDLIMGGNWIRLFGEVWKS